MRTLALAPLLLVAACSESPTETAEAPAQAPEPEPILCDCTLGSWVVLAQGRHLHLDIDCPEEFDHLDGRVEFTTAALRSDYEPALLREGAVPRLVRMTPGARLFSPIDSPRPRDEASYTVDVGVAAWMQRDLAFTADYVLLGSNSNSAMRAMLETAGLEVPERVLNGGGFFGEFPGINQSPGVEIPASEWPEIALPDGPRPLPTPLPDAWEPPAPIGADPAS